MSRLFKFIEQLHACIHVMALWSGGVFLLGMIIVTCVNIVSREVWKPLAGTYELIGFFGSLATALALGFTQRERGHIAVDVLVNAFPPGLRRLAQGVGNLAGCLFFGVLCRQLILYAFELLRSGELSETLRIGYYPFVFGVALGCGLLSLAAGVEAVKLLVNPAANGKSVS